VIKCAIFAIGSELLEGSLVDTNTAWLARRLAKRGVYVSMGRLLPDDKDTIMESFKEAAEKCDFVLTTGGLGPTFDDITAEVSAEAAGMKTEFYQPAWDNVVDRLSVYKIKLKESHKRQAFLPEKSHKFPNKRGTALGFAVENNGCTFISMPGIPYEMYHMFEQYVMPYIEERFELTEKHELDLRFANVPESDVDEAILEVGVPQEVECIINVSRGECFVKLRSFNDAVMKDFANKVRGKLEQYFMSYNKEDMQYLIVDLLKSKGIKLAVAESCTGGMIGSAITEIAGSSAAFLGGYITYSNEMKEMMLGVKKETMVEHGAVSEETCTEMLMGVSEKTGAECAIAVTGVAGPDGGTKDKPVGTVVIGVKCGNSVKIEKKFFRGDRETIRIRTMKMAFTELIHLLRAGT